MRRQRILDLGMYALGRKTFDETPYFYPKTAERQWRAVVIMFVACSYRDCDARRGMACWKAGSGHGGGRRLIPHFKRMTQAIQTARGQGGCQICGSHDWLIPRRCSDNHIHGICHACWSHRLLKGQVPALMRTCPDHLGEADTALLALAGGNR